MRRRIRPRLSTPSQQDTSHRAEPLPGQRWFEELETRLLMSADVASIDGTGNNLTHPLWGSAGSDLLRMAPAAYADGIAAPAGATRPSARAISNALAASDHKIPNSRDLSAMIFGWGQFLDHDLDLTPAANPAEPFNVQVPKGDPYFDPFGTGTQVIPLNRSMYDSATGTSTSTPRLQVSVLTSFIDGSMVYGSDNARAAALRTFVGGTLKTSPGNLLPLNSAGLENANDAHLFPDDQLFLAGDIRVNENVELTSMQTLFMREHNRLAAQYAAENPTLTDEQLYQKARRMVIAEIQSVTYNEFIPALLGRDALPRYRGYDPTVNPGIALEFSTAAFRIGHTLLDTSIGFLDNNGDPVRDPMLLAQAFFNSPIVKQSGIDPILKFLASDRAQEVDTRVTDGVRNFLFGPPGAGGLDLASLNLQRGRDHGMADYNSVRAAYGLPRVKNFAQITSDPQIQATLRNLYGNVNNMDLWITGRAEDHVPGSSVGPTFRRIIADQFRRARDGDRFFYQNVFSGKQLEQLQDTRLADIIRRNSNTTNIQDNVFFFDVSAAGTVFDDRNGNGLRDHDEPGLNNRTVRLLDADGNLIATTTTRGTGDYAFGNLDLGHYQVQVETADGWTCTTPDAGAVHATLGGTLHGINFGFTRSPLVVPPICAQGAGGWHGLVNLFLSKRHEWSLA
jgi:hypothetical protein